MTLIPFLRKYWIYALIATLPFERLPSINVMLSGHSVTLRLSYVVALVGFGLFYKPLLRLVRARWTSPQFWMLAYLFVAFLSALVAIDVGRAALALIATAITMGTGLIVAQTVRPDQMPRIYQILGLMTAAVCIFGLYQFLGDSLGLSSHLTGLSPNYTRQVFGFPRVQSTGLEPLFFGNFLLIPLALTISKILDQRATKWTYGLLVLIITTVTLTLSRGTFYAAGIGFLLLIILLAGRQNFIQRVTTLGVLVVGIGLGIGLIALSPELQPSGGGGEQAIQQFAKQSTTVTSSATSADSDRVVNRRLAIEAFKQRPILGYGLGNFGPYVEQTHPKLYGEAGVKVVVNNEYAEVLAETGVVGALALLGLALSLIWLIIRSYQTASSHQRAWIAGLTAAAVGFVVQYYAFSTLYVMHIWVAIGLLIALASSTINHEASTSAD